MLITGSKLLLSHLIYLIVIFFLIYLQGCSFVILGYATFSEPNTSNFKTKQSIRGKTGSFHLIGSRDNIQFHLPELKLSVATEIFKFQPISIGLGVLFIPLPLIPFPFFSFDDYLDYHGKWHDGWDHRLPFWIVVEVHPKVEGLLFDPLRVSLNISGQILSPRVFLGHERGIWDSCYWNSNFLSRAIKKIQINGKIKLIHLEPWGAKGEKVETISCLWLRFDIPPPSPTQSFDLIIDAFERESQSLPTLSIHFKKGAALVLGGVGIGH